MAGVCPRISTYPPTGSVTLLQPHQTHVEFTAVIEWERNRAYPFDFVVVFSDAAAASANDANPSSWQQLPLPRTADSPSRVFTPEQACRHATFSASVPIASMGLVPRHDGALHGVFSFRYQHYPGSPFKEMNVPGGVAKGEFIIPAARTPPSSSLEKSLVLESGWTASPLAPMSSGEVQAASWQVVSSDVLERSRDEDTVLVEKAIGKVVDQLRFFTIVRVEPFWYGATHDGESFHLTEHAILACFLTKSGQYISLLSYNGDDDFYQVFVGGPKSKICLGARNDSSADKPMRFLVSVSNHRQGSIAEVMAQARRLNERTPKMQSLLERALSAAGANPDSPSALSEEEDFFDNLGYCTWNGLGRDLTADSILAGLEKLTASGVVFNTLLIDDNWQSLGRTKLDPSEPGWLGWSRFQANAEGFPDGLAGIIKEVKSRYPHIQYVGVWHALLGYWAGLAHDAELAEEYKTRMTRCKVRLSVTADVLIVDPEDVHRMYDDFYAFLRAEGVDFVKTDVQHLVSMLVDPVDRADVPAAYQSAWTAAHLRHFHGKAIGCMSQVPQISFHSLLQNRLPRLLVRNNDDFFPEIPGSHTLHIFTNAHNALLTRHLNTLPDWDMFQTSHAYSSYHGAARSISGGPVLITDTPGEHDLTLIRQMTATTPSRKQIALRPAIATALDFYDRYADGRILKVAAACFPSLSPGKPAATSSGIIGCFNIADGEREILIPHSDFELAAGRSGRFVVRSFQSGQIFTFHTPISKLVKVRLFPRSWDILTASPVLDVGGSASVAVLGLTDKMSGAAAITKLSVSDDGSSVEVHLKALGRLSILTLDAEREVRKVMVDGEATIEADFISSASAGQSSKLFTVDLEEWWAQNGKWNNSKLVRVRVVF